MNSLTYEAQHSYRFLKTIYERNDGTSAFYEAFDEREKRKVGIKVVHVTKKDVVKARSEALTLHLFSHATTSIPALYQTHYDEKTERFYLIMQLIEQGRTLEQMLKGQIPLHQSIQLLIGLCDALTPLHQKKYQHRDIKPANIMVQGNNVYLIDFNLTSSLPFKGEGTEHYRAPEQSGYVLGIGQDRADIFSIGVLFYEMAIGKQPKLGEDFFYDRKGTTWRFFKKPMEHNPQLPQKVNDLIERCMSVKPELRPRDANELKRELIQLKRGIR